jgi:hypothetical protein
MMVVTRRESPLAICKTNLRTCMSSEFNLAGARVVRFAMETAGVARPCSL